MVRCIEDISRACSEVVVVIAVPLCCNYFQVKYRFPTSFQLYLPDVVAKTCLLQAKRCGRQKSEITNSSFVDVVVAIAIAVSLQQSLLTSRRKTA